MARVMRDLYFQLLFLLALHGLTGVAVAFDVPERLEYDIKWWGIKAGYSTLETGWVQGDRIQITSTTKSVDWVTSLYPVDDRVLSILDAKMSLSPVFYHLKTREGSRLKDEEMRFDFANGTVLYLNHIENKEEDFSIPQEVFDPLSALFRIRNTQLTVGESAYVMLFDNEFVYRLEVQVLRKERVTVPAGTFDTVLIRPLLQSDGIFSRKGPIYTWLSDDRRKIPVKIKTRVAIGSLTMELMRIERR
jgi:hypothetical protein